MAEAFRGRGPLSSIDLLPRECDEVVAWAAQALIERKRTQLDIYAEFVTRCERIMQDSRGEVEFAVPSLSSFNRYSTRKAAKTRRQSEMVQIAGALREVFDGRASDDVTVLAAESIKTTICELLDRPDLEPKQAKELAEALRAAVQASGMSAEQRRKWQAEYDAKVAQAVDQVAKVRGLTADTVEAIKGKILGVAA